MPELPEVETFCRGLREVLQGRRIIRTEVFYHKIIRYPEVEAFIQMLQDREVLGVSRFGKYAVIHLDKEQDLVVHFRMTAHFLAATPDEPRDKHTHVVFYLDDKTELRFVEPRKFGTMHLIPQGQFALAGGIAQLGPEPLTAEFTPAYLAAALKNRSGKLKSLLLDQRVIAGLGNIYVDEALFRAGILPTREASSLSPEELNCLAEQIDQVIGEAIRCKGSSVRDYCDVHGESGSFQKQHNVYGRGGQACPHCGSEIQKTVVGGRGTHYCPECQK